ncbi:MAG: hypothetical protein COA42_15900 [Alteromonadaceae bacterium]|nr:MAG: hypothetical protein COA42_15900 [Alteromonadaceae bacterium]
MNVTFDGYLSYTCTSCTEAYNVEGKSLMFTEDTSLEAEEDDYIRYLTQLKATCKSCSQEMQISLDVWEYPESVANYSYHSGKGVSAIECEFSIEHYFDDEVAIKEGRHDEPEVDASAKEGTEGDGEADDADEKVFNEETKVEVYTDLYDPEE